MIKGLISQGMHHGAADTNCNIFLGNDQNDMTIAPIAAPNNDTPSRWYPTQDCRRATGTLPYDTDAPRVAFLQLGVAQAHRSILEDNWMLHMSKEERMLMMTTSWDDKLRKDVINDTIHRRNPEMITTSEDKMKVWAYLMVQYNLQPELKKFGKHGETTVIKELTLLHIMYTWSPLDPTKLSREQKMKALSSLLFL